MKTRLQVRVDRDICMGSGNCTYWAPGVFDMDDDCIAVVIDIDAAGEEEIRLAVEGCPTGALSFVDADDDTDPTTDDASPEDANQQGTAT